MQAIKNHGIVVKEKQHHQRHQVHDKLHIRHARLLGGLGFIGGHFVHHVAIFSKRFDAPLKLSMASKKSISSTPISWQIHFAPARFAKL